MHPRSLPCLRPTSGHRQNDRTVATQEWKSLERPMIASAYRFAAVIGTPSRSSSDPPAAICAPPPVGYGNIGFRVARNVASLIVLGASSGVLPAGAPPRLTRYALHATIGAAQLLLEHQ